MNKNIKIGTRASALAVVQAESVRDAIQKSFPGMALEIIKIKTTGDKILDSPLSKIGDKGLFTKELENALLEGEIDLAVHSMKDMPTSLPEGLTIGAVTERINPADIFIPNGKISFSELNRGSSVATGSLRRRAQLAAMYPGIKISDMRGNVLSRLEKLRADKSLDGMILAAAGFIRLGLDMTEAEIIPPDIMIPAVGQASLAIETRRDDERIASIVFILNHEKSAREILCERAFLSRLEGGCQVPIAGHAVISGSLITIHGLVSSVDGKVCRRDSAEADASEYLKAGYELAGRLISAGADKILDEIYHRTGVADGAQQR